MSEGGEGGEGGRGGGRQERKQTEGNRRDRDIGLKIEERSLEESRKEVVSKRYTVRTEVRERWGMKCKREDACMVWW